MQIPEWVALRAFDEDKPVYLPSGQISDYLPVLDRQVKHDPPREENGVRFWRVSCTRDTLIGVVQSINSNTICVHGTAHQEDVLREMTRLGAVVRHKYHDDDKTGKRTKRHRDDPYHTWTPIEINPHTHTLRGSAREIGLRHQRLQKICSNMCYAISKWPRLIHAKRADAGHSQCNFSCYLTRVWVQFFNKPPEMTDKSWTTLTASQFLSHWDGYRWIRDVFTALMTIRFQVMSDLNASAALPASESEVLFKVIDIVARHPAGCFWPVVFDSGYRSKEDNKMLQPAYIPKNTQPLIEEMLYQLRQALSDKESTFTKDNAKSYVELVRQECCSSVPPATLFSADCLDADGSSPERSALENAFQKQDMRILRWSDSFGASDAGLWDVPGYVRNNVQSPTPAMFPPHWNVGSMASRQSTPAILISYGE